MAISNTTMFIINLVLAVVVIAVLVYTIYLTTRQTKKEGYSAAQRITNARSFVGKNNGYMPSWRQTPPELGPDGKPLPPMRVSTNNRGDIPVGRYLPIGLSESPEAKNANANGIKGNIGIDNSRDIPYTEEFQVENQHGYTSDGSPNPRRTPSMAQTSPASLRKPIDSVSKRMKTNV